MKRWLLVFIAALAIFTNTNCKGNRGTPDAVLHFAVQSNFEANISLSPFGSFLINDLPLHASLYSSLFSLDAMLRPYPFLLERYEKHGAEVIFFLKRNLRFSDGRKITANDVVWSIIQSIQNLDIPNPIYKHIEGGELIFRRQANTSPGIGVLSPDRFFIRFTRDNELFPYYLSWKNTAVVPVGWMLDKPVFSGPYVLDRTEARPDRTLVYLKVNPFYAGPVPKVSRICFHFFRTMEAFESSVKAGETDMFLNFIKHSMPIHPSFMILRTPILGGLYITLNPNRGALKSRDFRQYLFQLVDFSSLISRNRWLNFSPSTHMLPYGLEEYFILKPFAVPSRRKERLEHPVRISTTNFPSDVRSEIIRFWQTELKTYNIDLQTEWVEPQEFYRRLRATDLETAFFFYLMDVPVAIYFYESLFIQELELNPHYTVARAMQLLDEYRQTPPSVRLLSILAELEGIAREEVLLIPVYNLVATVGFKKWVHGFRYNHLLQIPFEEMTFEKRN